MASFATIGIYLFRVLGPPLLALLFSLALAVDECPLSLINLPTDFIRLLGNLLNRVSPKLVHEVLEEEPELTREVLIPLLFVSFLPLSVY